MIHWLDRLLRPDSIAIVGASERIGSLAASTHQLLMDRDYSGDLFSVNPKYKSLYDRPCYADLDALPKVPDLVVYAISGLALEASFDRAVALGVGGIVIYAANYIENDPEPRLPERLRQKAAAAGIPVCGGNSMGFYNYDSGVFVSFDQPPPERPPGHIGLLLHSGSGMTYLANNDGRFCFNYVIASAQETYATVGDYMDFLLHQPSTRVIAIVLEAVRDVDRFVAALRNAVNNDIPVVVTRLGRTEKSSQLALSHSGAIVGNHDAFIALCQRYGVILCKDIDEMIVTAMLFANGCRADHGGLSSMLDSGGLREQMIDLAEDYGVEFADISAATTAALAKELETGLDAVNPMDGMGALGQGSERVFRECGKALLDDPDTALLSFEFEFRDRFSHYPELFGVARELAAHNHKPLILVNSSSYSSIQESAAQLCWDGIPVINGIDVALRAIRNLMAYRDFKLPQESSKGVVSDAAVVSRWKAHLNRHTYLDEKSSLAMMADFGMPAVAHEYAESAQGVRQAASRVGFPVVLKTAEPGHLHKSDKGGVFLNIRNEKALDECYQDLVNRIGSRAIVMPMIEPGVEVALGMKCDPQFGPMVIVACGGELIELINERAYCLAPVDADTANEMIDGLKLKKLLAGFRGRPPADRDGLIALIVAFSQVAYQLADIVAEIDLNPVIVGGNGCSIVDALVIAEMDQG